MPQDLILETPEMRTMMGLGTITLVNRQASLQIRRERAPHTCPRADPAGAPVVAEAEEAVEAVEVAAGAEEVPLTMTEGIDPPPVLTVDRPSVTPCLNQITPRVIARLEYMKPQNTIRDQCTIAWLT
jgi:hypothetical protein